jgi:hypothetical protein
MAVDPDEEALSWGTERDATHVESPEVAAPVVGEDELGEPAKHSNGSAVLVLYGVIAGVFILYIVGWIVAIQRIDTSDAGALALIVERVGQFLAFLSPAVWFFGILLLVPSTKTRLRVLLLVLGVVLLPPWPFILGF